jgi:crotonobetainyl-CoA:carnitine CoA-transferase CaiB-like acyl-CoA transferase
VKALAGLRVIDLTQAMAAPFCSMNLADMGADVIKVEPPTGEDMRRGSASRNGHSGTFLTINRSKRGITLDLKQPAGVEVMHRLVTTADVFVQNYRPGAAKRLGVDYETLAALNPRLIYCSISGFGATGPYASRGGYDLIAQGMSGIISVTGDEDGPPAKAGLPVSDLAAGLFGAYGILCALEHRERTGQGQLVDTSLLEAAMALTVWEATEYWAAQHLAARIVERAPAERGLGLGLEAPVGARVALGVEVADGDVDPGMVVLAAGLDQQDRDAGIGRQPVGEHAARGAGADHDVVEAAELLRPVRACRHAALPRPCRSLATRRGRPQDPAAQVSTARVSGIVKAAAIVVSVIRPAISGASPPS